ncbi:N-alpha-acetyltransferase 80 [Amia ocellicauda]|uniref:N-alpha-acetyltransferase 80 n=1 Tax=Amia ocellicauda TaxID=2972642 RepID=UPI0034647824
MNAEWQRSQGARIHSLEKSCDDFPLCLVLLRRGAGGQGEKLLGHARLSRVVGQRSSLFVESVVVALDERGKGYGRQLMEEAERYARGRGFRRLCLTTHDKQHFYARLGFVLSRPVQSAGAMTAFVPMEALLRFSRPAAGDEDDDCDWRGPVPTPPPSSLPLPGERPTHSVAPHSPVAPPLATRPVPPASPPPAVSAVNVPSFLSTSAPPPPPPPPPPQSTPPPPPTPPPSAHTRSSASLALPSSKTLLETPYRDAKGQPIFWMQKDI